MPAGDNEYKFRKLLLKKFKNCLGGKRSFKSKITGHNEPVSISVDESIALPDGKNILIEVDSGNYAKLLAGQYALINGLFKGNRNTTLFLVVHFYKTKGGKEYNASRTIKNLNAIQSFNPSADWLPFGAVTFSEFSSLVETAKTLDELGTMLWGIKHEPTTSQPDKK